MGALLIFAILMIQGGARAFFMAPQIPTQLKPFYPLVLLSWVGWALIRMYCVDLKPYSLEFLANDGLAVCKVVFL